MLLIPGPCHLLAVWGWGEGMGVGEGCRVKILSIQKHFTDSHLELKILQTPLLIGPAPRGNK